MWHTPRYDGSVTRTERQPLVRGQDLVWLLLFSALAWLSPHQDAPELETLALLGLFQIIEPRLAVFSTPRGRVAAVGIKLLIGYLLIGVSGAINSSYYLILLVPVVSAATAFGAFGTAVFTLLACGSYLSFLYFPRAPAPLLPSETRELTLRILFLVVVSYLTNQLAKENRTMLRRYQASAAELVQANQNLMAAEAEMRRGDRMAALGQMSAGLAHELRNPLGTIRASAELLQKKLKGADETSGELVEFIASEVDRMNSLVTRFLDFARPLRLRKEPDDLTLVMDRAIAELGRREPPFDITIHRNYAPDVRPISCDRELMQRVFYNLLLNACEATPSGGVVSVRTRSLGPSVEAAVIDRGSGIDGAHRETIFNPFFTTKPNGVGLGLAIVSKIVAEHGGQIAVESEPGEGSTFRVLLPA